MGGADFWLVPCATPAHDQVIMKTSAFFRIPLATLVAVSLMAFAAPCEGASPKWEYLAVKAAMKTPNLQRMLDEQGAQGWELVAFTRKDVAVFKRPAR